MGITEVKMTIKNPRYPSKTFTGNFLIDSGAVYSVVPATILKKIGIKPQRSEEFSLADGKIITRQVGNVFYEYGGKEAAAPVLFGEKDDYQLLGVVTLEALGLNLDPLKRTIYKPLLRM